MDHSLKWIMVQYDNGEKIKGAGMMKAAHVVPAGADLWLPDPRTGPHGRRASLPRQYSPLAWNQTAYLDQRNGLSRLGSSPAFPNDQRSASCPEGKDVS